MLSRSTCEIDGSPMASAAGIFSEAVSTPVKVRVKSGGADQPLTAREVAGLEMLPVPEGTVAD